MPSTPSDDTFKLVAEDLVAVLQSETRDWFSSVVLNLHSNPSRHRGREIQFQFSTFHDERFRGEFTAGVRC